jgi:hypothetical protein
MYSKLIIASAIALSPLILNGCSSSEETKTEAATTQKGNLTLVANGEDFVRQGFVAKDGWQINFDSLQVKLAEVKAYQTDPPFDPQANSEIKPQETVTLVEIPTIVDLAAGEEDAEPIIVAQTEAPVGSYNAIAWKVVPGTENQAMVFEGTATKDNQSIPFLISLNQPLDYLCGEFVGEQRKGIVQAGETAEVETTFHFDHLFGDASLPPEDSLNQHALGFQPLANLAENGKVTLEQTTLAQKLSPQDYQTWQKAIAGLGHVGEGHCKLKIENPES